MSPKLSLLLPGISSLGSSVICQLGVGICHSRWTHQIGSLPRAHEPVQQVPNIIVPYTSHVNQPE
jgi:hypothetical protein